MFLVGLSLYPECIFTLKHPLGLRFLLKHCSFSALYVASSQKGEQGIKHSEHWPHS
jgi:hypothetical protein